MKIIFLQNVLYDYRVDFYNGLVEKGHDVTVIHSGAFNQNVCLFEQTIKPKIKLLSLFYQYNLPNLAQYDVVISMFDLHWISNILPVFTSRKNRFLFWGHGFGNSDLGNKLRKWFIRKSDGLILYNQQKKQLLQEAGINDNKLFVANNTLAVTNAGRSEQERKQFLFVGRIQERKRVDIFIQAFAKVMNDPAIDKSYSIAIIGDGEQRRVLEALSEKLAIRAQCQFLGKVTEDEALKEQFDKSLAYVSPGPMGLGVNHAFAYGVPTLSNRTFKHGPETWILNENNSLWINSISDDEQIEQLSEQMLLLINDNVFADKLGVQAYNDYLQYCSMSKMIDGFTHAISGENDE